jgi:hypothetical protein
LLKRRTADADTTDMHGLADLKRIPRRSRMIAVAGVGLLLATVLLKELVLQAPSNIVSPPLVVHNKAPHTTTPTIDLRLPAALRVALARHPVVVAVVFDPSVPGDSDAVAAARQGAAAAHVGFAALDVGNELTARGVALQLESDSEPSVVVVRRPGTVSMLLPGYNDAQLVAQAARQP